jgi:hypothetical protein
MIAPRTSQLPALLIVLPAQPSKVMSGDHRPTDRRSRNPCGRGSESWEDDLAHEPPDHLLLHPLHRAAAHADKCHLEYAVVTDCF